MNGCVLLLAVSLSFVSHFVLLYAPANALLSVACPVACLSQPAIFHLSVPACYHECLHMPGHVGVLTVPSVLSPCCGRSGCSGGAERGTGALHRSANHAASLLGECVTSLGPTAIPAAGEVFNWGIFACSCNS